MRLFNYSTQEVWQGLGQNLRGNPNQEKDAVSGKVVLDSNADGAWLEALGLGAL